VHAAEEVEGENEAERQRLKTKESNEIETQKYEMMLEKPRAKQNAMKAKRIV
jgi:hypothetical protein